MSGYSGTPLVKKLGLKEAFRVTFAGAPEGFAATLGHLPAGVSLVESGVVDLAVLFAHLRADLESKFENLATRLVPDGMLWVAWPKKTSRVPTDLTENVVREVGLEAGLVDVKVCAIDEVWSGLKFVIRIKDRPRTPQS